MQNNRLPLIVDRSENGPFISESAYDLALVRKTAELVKKHGLKFDPQVLVPDDNDMADRLYQAGLELFIEMGVYNQSTERRILFTRDEVEATVAAAPDAVILGCGRDAVVEKHRDVESTVPCRMHSGPTGTPCSERSTPSSCILRPGAFGGLSWAVGRLPLTWAADHFRLTDGNTGRPAKRLPSPAKLSGKRAGQACTSKMWLCR